MCVDSRVDATDGSRSPRWIVLALTLLAQGCYLAHGLDPRGDRPEPRAPDAAIPEPGPEPRDPDGDAGPPLPAEPDPDLGPDSRPSDYPDSDDWSEPPDLDEDDPCCTLGEPVLVTSRDGGPSGGERVALEHAPPLIEWGPNGWGLLAGGRTEETGFEERRALFFELAPDGAPTGPPRRLDGVTDVLPADLRWAEGRWAVGLQRAPEGPDTREVTVRLFDREMRPTMPWLPLGPAIHGQLALARLTHRDRWMSLRGTDGSIAALAFAEWGRSEPAEYPRPSTGRSLDAVGLRSRVAVVGGFRENAEVMVLGGEPDHPLLGRVELSRSSDSGTSALAALRDRVVVVGDADERTWAEVVDPFALESVAEARTLGAFGEERPVELALDVAGSDKLGVAGVCYGDGAGDRSAGRIVFRLVGPDGDLRGAAVDVVDGFFRAGIVTCAVGADDRGFLVGWWDGAELWVRRVFVREE